MVVQNGVNKKITISSLLASLDSTTNIQVNPSRNPITVNISSQNLPNIFFVNGPNDFIGINTNAPQALLHINGTTKIGSSANDGILINSDEAVDYTLSGDYPLGSTWFKPLSAYRELSSISVDNGVSVGQFDLTNGSPGQYKTITLTAVQSGSKATVRVLGGVNFNRIDFTLVGQSVILRCILIAGVPKWVCLGSYLVTLYTV